MRQLTIYEEGVKKPHRVLIYPERFCPDCHRGDLAMYLQCPFCSEATEGPERPGEVMQNTPQDLKYLK